MKTAITLMGFLLALLLTGCVGIVVPLPSDGQTHGKVITKEHVKFIVHGQTKRAEVVERLGSEFRDSPRMPALAYSWETPAAGWLWGALVVVPPSGKGWGGHSDGSHWRALFLRFDNGERVSAMKFVSLSSRKSLDEQLEIWAQRHGAAPSQAIQSLVSK